MHQPLRPLNQQTHNRYTTTNNNNTTQRPPFGRAGQLVRFGTYNTRTLANTGDAEQLADDLSAAGVHICGLQEVRNRGSGQRRLGGSNNPSWQLLWSGDNQHRIHGVGALLSPMAAHALTGWPQSAIAS